MSLIQDKFRPGAAGLEEREAMKKELEKLEFKCNTCNTANYNIEHYKEGARDLTRVICKNCGRVHFFSPTI